ncbi:hypothetical protein Poli38472_008838 [Pythium oligandrum]|uniref:LicD/FKTN/FKRP nucleotidyltransferase domain-containing protein n=1 Tax=Pythium oligandrum TaxID=41045 RepID=A0A8K1FAF4_PYTOL|nr:hypothetical protein Poli38472_008838 [Pythium oligandrum]|eukprot:TMW56190.1 hypothetical protein Poli38472_008838 [Pythium oligandrum]
MRYTVWSLWESALEHGGGCESVVMLETTKGCSPERVILVLLTVLLLGLINLAYVANLLTITSPSSPNQELQPAHDDEGEPTRYVFRAGAAMPARGPPHHRPGCVTLSSGHLEDRFIREDACYKRAEVVQIITDLVLTVTDAFIEHNITYFLESGTLLGSYRHGGVIPHDFDGDVAIDTAGYEYLRDHLIEFPPKYEMNVWKSAYYENANRDDKLSARLIHKESALYVDVFVFHDRVHEESGRELVGPEPSVCYAGCVECPKLADGRTQLLVPREWIYPLRNCEFAEQTRKCPARTPTYLRYLYGERFMVPM